MTYADGQCVQLGDTVHIGGDQSGVIVAIIGDGAYASGYRQQDWQYLGSGIIVSTDFGDLRLDEPDEDLELVARPETVPRHRM